MILQRETPTNDPSLAHLRGKYFFARAPRRIYGERAFTDDAIVKCVMHLHADGWEVTCTYGSLFGARTLPRGLEIGPVVEWLPPVRVITDADPGDEA